MAEADSGPLRFSNWSECTEQLAQRTAGLHGIRRLEVAGEQLYIKQGMPRGYGWPRVYLISVLVRLATGRWPAREPLRRSGADRIAFEAARLSELRAAGVLVPEVRFQFESLIVLEDVGPTVKSRLEQVGGEQRSDLIDWVAGDLARFHNAGHWHAAAQLRNLTINDGRLYRIDFEEDLRGVLPLPMRQAMDAFLLAFSIAQHRRLGIPKEREVIARQFLANWAGALDSDQPVGALHRVTRWLSPLERCTRIFKWVPSQDLDAFRVVVGAMRASRNTDLEGQPKGQEHRDQP